MGGAHEGGELGLNPTIAPSPRSWPEASSRGRSAICAALLRDLQRTPQVRQAESRTALAFAYARVTHMVM